MLPNESVFKTLMMWSFLYCWREHTRKRTSLIWQCSCTIFRTASLVNLEQYHEKPCPTWIPHLIGIDINHTLMFAKLLCSNINNYWKFWKFIEMTKWGSAVFTTRELNHRLLTSNLRMVGKEPRQQQTLIGHVLLDWHF